MIESLVEAFTKNNFLFKKSNSTGEGGFQETLDRYDQTQERSQYNNYKSEDSQRSAQETFKANEYDESTADEYSEVVDTYEDDENKEQTEDTSSSTEAVKEEEPEEEHSEQRDVEAEAKDEVSEKSEEEKSDIEEILSLLEKLGISKEELQAFKKGLKNSEKEIKPDHLLKILESFKGNLKNSKLPTELVEKAEAFIEKLEQALNSKEGNPAKKLAELFKAPDKQGADKTPLVKEDATLLKNEQGKENRVDNQIKHNNTKFAEMKELSQDAKNVKFRSEVDPRFAQQDTQKTGQNLQAKQAQLNLAAQGNQSGTNNQQNFKEDLPGKSPDFLKKMKNILKVNKQQSSQLNEAAQADLSKSQVQNNKLRPSFMNRLSNGRFLQQMVDRIQNMVKAGTTLSASVDFKSSEFGDMKLAAEAQGTNLAVKLSNIASNMKADVMSIKNELELELKNLGFENIELDFGGEENSGRQNAFEDEMQKRLSGEHVKLPGDQLADIKAIEDWMRDYQKVM